MRSYSSVLSHVLGSHPEVDGYCETHLRYRFSLDFLRLQWRVRRLTGEPLSGRFVLDKVLHDYPLVPSVLERPKARVIVLLRKPDDVLQSIVHMGTHLDANEQNASVAKATASLRQSRESTYGVGTTRRSTSGIRRVRNADEAHRRCLCSSCRTSSSSRTPLARRYRHFSPYGKAGAPGIRRMRFAVARFAFIAIESRASPFPSSLMIQAEQAYAECFPRAVCIACRCEAAPAAGVRSARTSVWRADHSAK